MGKVRQCPPYAQAKGMKGGERVDKRWGKNGQRVGIVRERPPYAQAIGIKGGERMDERWDKPGKAHPMPRQQIRRLGKG